MQMARMTLALVGAFALALAGCGGGASFKSGKDSAAQAAFDLSQATAGTGGFFAQGIGPLQGALSLKCKTSGTASIENLKSEVVTGGAVTASQTLTLKYDKCSHDGKLFRSGTLEVKRKLMVENTGVVVEVELEGRVDYTGDVTDFVQLDVTQKVSAEKLSATSGKVSVTLTGTIENSTGRYEFSGDVIEVSAGVVVTRS